MSSLSIFRSASMTLPGFPDFESPIISPRARGMTCHDTPNRSLSQPQRPSSPPSDESRFQMLSSSSCVSHVATIKNPSENEKLGPPSIAVNSRPSSSKLAFNTVPFGRGVDPPSLRMMLRIFEFLMTDVYSLIASSAWSLNVRLGVTAFTCCSSTRYLSGPLKAAYSCASPPVLRPRLPSSVELRGKPVEAGLPQIAISVRPIVQLAERLRAQGVEPAAAIRADPDESGLFEDGELSRYARLSDIDDLYELAHRALTHPECLDETAAGRVAQDLEDIGHETTYYYHNICVCNNMWSRRSRGHHASG